MHWTKRVAPPWFAHDGHDLAQPALRKSRQTLALLPEKGVTPTIREYLQQPPSKVEVETLLDMVGGEPARADPRRRGGVQGARQEEAEVSKADIAKAIVAHPILLQRPVVVAGKKAAIGRPPEAALPLLK